MESAGGYGSFARKPVAGMHRGDSAKAEPQRKREPNKRSVLRQIHGVSPYVPQPKRERLLRACQQMGHPDCFHDRANRLFLTVFRGLCCLCLF